MPNDIAHDSAGVLEELQRPALRDGAEMLHELIVSHTVASVLTKTSLPMYTAWPRCPKDASYRP